MISGQVLTQQQEHRADALYLLKRLHQLRTTVMRLESTIRQREGIRFHAGPAHLMRTILDKWIEHVLDEDVLKETNAN